MKKTPTLEVVSNPKPAARNSKPNEALRQHMANAIAFHQLSKNCAQHAIFYGARVGAELTVAKELCGHGQFMKWVNKHLPMIGHKTAGNYMKLANGLQAKVLQGAKLETVSNLDLLKLPDPRNLKATENSQIAQAIKKLTDGKTITGLYEDLGIVKARKTKGSTGKEKLNKATADVAGEVEDSKAHMAALQKIWVDELEEQFSPDALKARIEHMAPSDLKRFVELLRGTLKSLT